MATKKKTGKSTSAKRKNKTSKPKSTRVKTSSVKANTKSTKKHTSNTAVRSADRVKASALAFLYIFSFLSVCLIGYTIYYFRNSPPTTVTTGYVDSLAYAPEETYPIELQYYTNDANNGLQVLEYRWNYYTDILIPSTDTEKEALKTEAGGDTNKLLASVFKIVYSSGLQMIGEDIVWEPQLDKHLTNITGYYTPKTPYYFNSTNGTSYGAVNKLDYKDSWIIDFGKGKLGKITQDKELQTVGQFLWITSTLRADVNLLMRDLYNSIKVLDYGKQVLMFDLSNYLTFEYFSTDDLKFHTPKADEMKLFVNILVNKDKNGMVSSDQSLFGIVRDNPDWSYDGVSASDYWTTHTEINLSQADFDLVNGKLKLKDSAVKYYSNYDAEALDMVIYIDLSQTEATGLTSNAFGNLQVDKLIITSTYATTFTYYTLPENCTILASDNVTLEVVE